MPDAAQEWTDVVESMRTPLRRLVELVRQEAGDLAQALTVYGAVVHGPFDPARQTARSVLIVSRVDLSMLRRLAAHGLTLGKAGIAAPLIMTPEYIRASRDTFPLELLDIHLHHAVLFGKDHFATLDLEPDHLRLQCERELKTTLIGLRQAVLASLGQEKFIGAVETDVAEGLLRTLRGLLWLKGERTPLPQAEVLGKIEDRFERKLPGLREALDPQAHHGWAELERLYAEVEMLGERVNAL